MRACWSASKLNLHCCSSSSSLPRSPCPFSGRGSFALAGQWQKRSHSFTVHAAGQGHGRVTMRSWQESVKTGGRVIISAPFKSGECGTNALGKEFRIKAIAKKSKNNVVTMSVVGPESTSTLFMILTGCAAVGQVSFKLDLANGFASSLG